MRSSKSIIPGNYNWYREYIILCNGVGLAASGCVLLLTKKKTPPQHTKVTKLNGSEIAPENYQRLYTALYPLPQLCLNNTRYPLKQV